MRADFFQTPGYETKARRIRPRRSLSDRVREALLVLAEKQAKVLTHEEKAWASITFAGTRHSLTMEFDGEGAVACGENFIEALPEHEFVIPGQLVAEAEVNEIKHSLNPHPSMILTVILLLLEEA